MGKGFQGALRVWAGALACAAVLGAMGAMGATAAHAQQASDPQQEMKQAWAAAKAAAKVGPTSIELRDQATLKIGKDEVFIPQPAAGQLGSDTAVVPCGTPSSRCHTSFGLGAFGRKRAA